MQVIHRYAEEIPDLGKAIANARIGKSLSQKELAKILGISPSLMSSLEREERAIAIALLRKIERVLNVELINFKIDEKS